MATNYESSTNHADLQSNRQGSMDDRQLWKEFKNGSENAYAFIYTNYFFILYRYGLKICPEREIVKDCIQDLFVYIWKNRENLTDAHSIKFYLITALKRRLIDTYAHAHRYIDSADIDMEAHLEPFLSTEQKLISAQITQEQKEQVRKALEALTDRQREAIYLRFYGNLPNEAIASKMAISLEAVYNVVSKAIQKLKHHVHKVYIATLILQLFWF